MSESVSFDKLFEDTPMPEVEESTEPAPEEIEPTPEPEAEPEPETEEQPTDEKDAKQEDEPNPVLATIEIDGQEFPLDEAKIQRLAEQYVDIAQKYKAAEAQREQVVQALSYIENIRNGVDVDDAMRALGVDFDALIHDKVKEFIRRSTMSAKERELEDANREREKLRKQIAEREERERREREALTNQQQAESIISSVNTAVAKIPEQYRKEIQLEVFGAIERRIRSGGSMPSARAIQNAVNTVYSKKQKDFGTKIINNKQTPPKPTKNSPEPSTQVKKPVYNATDYNEIFR